MATSAATIERTPLLDSLSQLRLIGERFEEFVARQCDELDSLRSGLTRREGELSQQQSQLDELHHLNELRAQQFEEQAARLDQLTAELADVRRELNNARQELSSPRRGEEDALRLRVDELERERRTLQADLAGTREEAAQQAEAAVELDRLRAELQSAREASEASVHLRAELDRALRELAAKSLESSAPPTTTTMFVGELPGDVELQRRLQAVERERDELAAELESIMGRSAALAENAARERRKVAEERNEWESELKSLRRALAAQLQAHTDAAHGPRLPSRNGGRKGRQATDKSGSQEAVIDSVIAQFAALKKTAGRVESMNEAVAARE